MVADRGRLFPGNHGSRYEVEDDFTCMGGDDDTDHVSEDEDHPGRGYLSRDVRMCVFLSSLRAGASKRLAQVRSRSLAEKQTTPANSYDLRGWHSLAASVRAMTKAITYVYSTAWPSPQNMSYPSRCLRLYSRRCARPAPLRVFKKPELVLSHDLILCLSQEDLVRHLPFRHVAL